MSLGKLTFSKSLLLKIAIAISCVVSLSIFIEFLPGVLILSFLSFFLFFLYPAIPTFLLTFIFLISQEVIVSPSFGLALQIPTEPFIVILGCVWVVYTTFTSGKRVTPYTLFDYAVAFYLATLALSVLLSSHKVISLKFFVNAFGYLIVCVYWTKYSLTNKDILIRLIKTFFIFAIILCIFTITKHSLYGFAKEFTNLMTDPFYDERGSYSAYLSIIFGFSFTISLSNIKDTGFKNLAIITALVTFSAIILSYTRASWLSCIFIIFVYFFLRAKTLVLNKNFWLFAGGTMVVFILLSSSLLVSLQENALTIIDVQRNVSNLERINRWTAAVNMFMSKPIFGFGVGTYPIHFYEYQNPLFSTIISDMYAGAHNDYLQYLSEGGIVGLSGWVFLLVSVFIKAFKAIKNSIDEDYSTIVLGATLGISTYLFHALFNGYLEFDKVAVPFWLCIGIILAIENIQGKTYKK